MNPELQNKNKHEASSLFIIHSPEWTVMEENKRGLYRTGSLLVGVLVGHNTAFVFCLVAQLLLVLQNKVIVSLRLYFSILKAVIVDSSILGTPIRQFCSTQFPTFRLFVAYGYAIPFLSKYSVVVNKASFGELVFRLKKPKSEKFNTKTCVWHGLLKAAKHQCKKTNVPSILYHCLTLYQGKNQIQGKKQAYVSVIPHN